MKKILFAMMACAGLCACTDDIDLTSGSTQKVFDTDVVYLNVNLAEVGTSSTSTRATATFEQATGNDGKVDNAHFYFYDENGIFVTKGEIDDTFTTSIDDNDDLNLESASHHLVILDGMAGLNYPKYVVTILNEPEGFEAPITLQEMGDYKLTSLYDGSGNLVMTTSSYAEAGDDTYKYVDVLNDDEFNLTAEDAVASDKALNIYVERLAAKITLKFDADEKYIDEDGFEFDETLGETNNTDKETVDTLATKFYVVLNEWALNATADTTYLMKHIDTDWSGEAFRTWDWDDYTHHRSYWAESCSYGMAPDEDNHNKVLGLHYVKYNEEGVWNDIRLLQTSGTSVYCMENTNSIDVIGSDVNDKYSPAITGIVVKGQIGHYEGNTFVGDTLARYEGMLYRPNDLCERLSHKYDLYTSSINAIENPMDTSYVTITDNYDGTAIISPRSGKSFYDSSNSSVTATFNDTINYYCNGYMYYIIPIKHLGGYKDGKLDEGAYGVVRNHHYVVTINSVSNLGKGVVDPDNEIIPSPNGMDVGTYDLGATVTVLSWREVDQDAGL